jgi:hypothetical protein
MLDLETSVMVIAELIQESLMCISPPCQPLAEFECNGETNDLRLSINATTTEELTATLDNFNSCPSLGVTSDMLNTLKISIANWGDARDGVAHLTSIKFNEIEIGDFCLEGKGRGFRDIWWTLVDMTSKKVLWSLVIWSRVGPKMTILTRMKQNDRVERVSEFGFVKAGCSTFVIDSF